MAVPHYHCSGYNVEQAIHDLAVDIAEQEQQLIIDEEEALELEEIGNDHWHGKSSKVNKRRERKRSKKADAEEGLGFSNDSTSGTEASSSQPEVPR